MTPSKGLALFFAGCTLLLAALVISEPAPAGAEDGATSTATTSSSPAPASDPPPPPAVRNRVMGEPCGDYPQGSACVSGLCIDATFFNLCSSYCTSDAECPSFWGCRRFTEGNGETAGICFPKRVIISNP